MHPRQIPVHRVGLGGLNAGAARHHAGIEGFTAERTTGIDPGAAARHVGGIERLAVERSPVVPLYRGRSRSIRGDD